MRFCMGYKSQSPLADRSFGFRGASDERWAIPAYAPCRTPARPAESRRLPGSGTVRRIVGGGSCTEFLVGRLCQPVGDIIACIIVATQDRITPQKAGQNARLELGNVPGSARAQWHSRIPSCRRGLETPGGAGKQAGRRGGAVALKYRQLQESRPERVSYQ